MPAKMATNGVQTVATSTYTTDLYDMLVIGTTQVTEAIRLLCRHYCSVLRAHKSI